MAPRKKVRRTSSLPGLVTDNSAGLSSSSIHPSMPLAIAPPLLNPPTTAIPMPPTTTTPTVPPPAYSFTFTTNLTPVTFQHADKDKKKEATSVDGLVYSAEGASPANSTASNSRKRNADALDDPTYGEEDEKKPSTSATNSSGKKDKEGHIPRPPNAFILFRSDLVARKAVPTSLEADHSTISKIIGVCWRTLPARQRKRWEQKALEAKAAHKIQYPDYRYTPVHRKNGPLRKKAKKEQKKDDDRAAAMAAMLLGGSTGNELENSLRRLDESNPDTYQTTLNFGNGGAGGGVGGDGQQQFTFVQGFPAGGHMIELPSAPNFNSPFHPRRHSSAPPAEQGFDHAAGSSSSAASTPRTPSRELSLGGGDPSPTDTTVPLSRIARKLPTKSTHHLQPHHFHAEAQIISGQQHQQQQQQQGGRKIKSSVAKAIRSRAQGFGNPLPQSERDQLFIQSRWTDAAMGGDAEYLAEAAGGEKQKKKKKKGGVIPSGLMLPTWDVNSGSNANNNGFFTDSKGSPAPGNTTEVGGYVAAEQYDSPSFATATAVAYAGDSEKYGPGHFDAGLASMGDMGLGMGLGGFDMLTYQDYGLSGMDGADAFPGADGTFTDAPAVGGNGDITAGMGGFDFADQFGELGVGNTEEYGYPFFNAAGSGPTSVNSTSPHNSDADDAAAYHPYDGSNVPAPLSMAAQDPLGPVTTTTGTNYSPHQPPSSYPQHPYHAAHPSSSSSYLPMPQTPSHLESTGAGMMYPPDWNAFQPVSGATPAHVDPLDPLDPLEPLPSGGGGQYGYEPANEGDAHSHSPVVQHLPPQGTMRHQHGMHPPTPAQIQHSVQAHRAGPPLQINMRYPPTASNGPYSAYPPSSTTSPITADIADQMNQFSMASASSPMKDNMFHHAMHSQSPMDMGHLHHHHHTHSSSMVDFHDPSQHQQQHQHQGEEQWAQWTHPDPFRSDSGPVGGESGQMSNGATTLDPLSPPLGPHGVGIGADGYRV